MAALIVQMKDGEVHYHGPLKDYEILLYTDSIHLHDDEGLHIYDMEQVDAMARIGCYHFGEFRDEGLQHGGKLMWLLGAPGR